MSQDINGTKIQLGQLVLIPARIHSTRPGDRYGNVTVQTLTPFFPGEHLKEITVNSKQLLVVEDPDDTLTLLGIELDENGGVVISDDTEKSTSNGGDGTVSPPESVEETGDDE